MFQDNRICYCKLILFIIPAIDVILFIIQQINYYLT